MFTLFFMSLFHGAPFWQYILSLYRSELEVGGSRPRWSPPGKDVEDYPEVVREQPEVPI